MDRRTFVKGLAAGMGGLGAFGVARAAASREEPLEEFTFVHLTDMHVRRARKGHIGYETCIRHINALRPLPKFVLMGGDGPFDGLYTPKEEFEDQIELFRSISAQLKMPFYHCIGNHDALGLSSRRKVAPDDPDIGKRFIMERLGMERSYYSFDAFGWHFVVLDSIDPIDSSHGPSYVPRIDEQQLEWLRFDLGAHAGKPTVAVSHIPAFSQLGQIRGDAGMPSVHDRVLHNGRDLRLILERHQVRALLQGHIHKTEDFYFNGVWYLSSPAVSAAWWGGNWRGFKPGYTLFTARNGTLSWERMEFDWEHHLEAEDDLERVRIREHEEFLAEQQRLLAEERPRG
jgi:3',5'-cyclic-AMP phosphodiesterase